MLYHFEDLNKLKLMTNFDVCQGLSYVNCLHVVSLNFEIVPEKCYSLAGFHSIQKDQTHFSEKI